MTSEQAKALKLLVEAVREAVQPEGTPAGTIYAALMAWGCTLNQFNSLVDGMVGAGLLRRQGQLLFPGKETP